MGTRGNESTNIGKVESGWALALPQAESAATEPTQLANLEQTLLGLLVYLAEERLAPVANLILSSPPGVLREGH